jgi:predicted phosphodiesterase
MKRFLTAALCLFVCTLALQAAKHKVKYGPWVPVVDETSFTVNWVTEVPTQAWVEVAPDDGTNFYKMERPRFYETLGGRTVTRTSHSVTVTGLKPGTRYRYKVCGRELIDGTNSYSVVFGQPACSYTLTTVKTLDASAATCKFTVVNDIHARDAVYKQLLAGKKGTDMDFLVMNGDMVSHNIHIDTTFKHVFQPVQELLNHTAAIYVRGNHESRGEEFDRFPEAFPMHNGGWYFTFRQGPAAFVVLDGGEDKPDSDVEYNGTAAFDQYRAAELEWLKTAVKDPAFQAAPVKICLIHIPMSWYEDIWYAQRRLYEDFLPVLNDAGITLMLSGHLHKYVVSEKGEGNNTFPIVVNSNNERMDVTIEGKKITLRFYDTAGKLVRTLNY